MTEVSARIRGALHFRPWMILRTWVLSHFPQTEVLLVDVAGNIGDANEMISSVFLGLGAGELVTIRATGDEEALVADMVRTFLERICFADECHPESDFSVVLDALAEALARHSNELTMERLAQLRARFGVAEAGRIIPSDHTEAFRVGALLHEWVIDLVSDIATHYQTPLTMAWHDNSRRCFDLSQPLSPGDMMRMLASSPGGGEPIIIQTWGPHAEECAKKAAAILRCIPQVALWLQQHAADLPRADRLARLLAALESFPADARCHRLGTALGGLLGPDSILALSPGHTAVQALLGICHFHGAHYGVDEQGLHSQIQRFIKSSPATLGVNLAWLHIVAEGVPDISCTMAVSREGIEWPTGETVRLILLAVTGQDIAQCIYVSHMAHAARLLNDAEFCRTLPEADSPGEVARRLRAREIEIGEPRPDKALVSVLLVESLADEATLLRDARINRQPCQTGVHTQFLYACSARAGESLRLDSAEFLAALSQRIQKMQPHYVLVHTGVAYHRFRPAYHAAIRTLRTEFPNIRFGHQEQPDLIVEAGVFSDDQDTLAFQRSFFENSRWSFRSGAIP